MLLRAIREAPVVFRGHVFAAVGYLLNPLLHRFAKPVRTPINFTDAREAALEFPLHDRIRKSNRFRENAFFRYSLRQWGEFATALYIFRSGLFIIFFSLFFLNKNPKVEYEYSERAYVAKLFYFFHSREILFELLVSRMHDCLNNKCDVAPHYTNDHLEL